MREVDVGEEEQRRELDPGENPNESGLKAGEKDFNLKPNNVFGGFNAPRRFVFILAETIEL